MAYSDVVIADGALGLWPLTDASAPFASATGGPALPLFSGSVTPQSADLVSEGLSTGLAGYLYDTNIPITVNGFVEFSIEAWFRVTEAQNNLALHFGDDAGNGAGICVSQSGGGGSGLLIQGLFAGLALLPSATTAVVGDVYHVVLTFIPGVGAQLYAQGAASGSLHVIGPNAASAQTRCSLIGDVGFLAGYQAALTPEQVAAHYTAGTEGGAPTIHAGLPSSTPVAYGPSALVTAGNQVIDAGVASSTATAYGASVFVPGDGVAQTIVAAPAVRGPVAFGPHQAEIAGTVHPPLAAYVVTRTDPAGVVVELDQSFTKTLYDQLNEPGSASIKLFNDDPDLALIGDSDMVRLSIHGQAALTMLVQDIERISVARGEEAEQVTTIGGPGHLAILEEALVYPSRGVSSRPVEEDRLFSWPSFDYDDSAWVGASVIPGGPGGIYHGNPWVHEEEWNLIAPTASWIWAHQALDNWEHPGPGYCYFRQRLTLDEDAAQLAIYCAADDQARVYFDGQHLIDTDFMGGTSGEIYNAVVLDVSAGEHVIAVEARNGFGPDDPFDADPFHFNPAGVLVSVNPLSTDGTVGSSILTTDGGWVMVEYPPFAPGMTPGEAMRHCIAEAQTRGALVGVTLGFTDEADSDGSPWPLVGDISTKVGTDVLTFFRELSATYIDMWMSPASLTLHAWRRDSRGSVKDVALHSPTDADDPATGNLLVLEHRRSTGNSTSMLTRWNGGWRESAISRPVRKEALLGLGAAQTAEESDRITSEQLGIYGDPRTAIRAEMEPIDESDTPYLAFRPSDTITAPAIDGTPTPERVIAMTVSEDSDGFLSYQPELKDLVLSVQERTEQAIKKMVNGTLRGDSKAATPVDPLVYQGQPTPPLSTGI